MLRKRPLKITIIEDDAYYNKALTKYINTICQSKAYQDFDFKIKSYASAHDFVDEYDPEINIMVLDYYLPNEDEHDQISGADLVDIMRKHSPDCKIIMISSQDSAHITAELLRKGIYEYVDKNVNTKDRIGSVIHQILGNEMRTQAH